MDEEKLINGFLDFEIDKAMEEMSVTALMADMANSVRTGVPISVDLAVEGAIMYHLRVEHNGLRFVGHVYRGFSLEAKESVAVVDNGFRAVAEAAYEAIVAPEVALAYVLEAEC
jgi:hypothetical protein